MALTTEASPTALSSIHYRSIDGLRAVAVVLVVLYHAEIPGFGQGYLGVDMFLAISGFLITTRLTSVTTVGRLTPLREFWAARARRIIPAVTLTIAVTCVASAVILAPQELSRVGVYGLASDLFVMNIVAAVRGGNYFAGPLRDSPFLHMWSLGVEEQFYLLLPLLLGPLMLVARKTAAVLRPLWSPRRVLVVVLAAVAMASFASQVVLTTASPLWAFFGLGPRMYEFLLGGLAALVLVDRVPVPWMRPLTLVGSVAVVVMLAGPWGTGTSPLLMLTASAATVALILGTVPDRPGSAVTPVVQPALESPSAAAIGRYSYSWYLWHWPAFVLALAASNESLGWARVACIGSLLPAMIAYHVVEQPVRQSMSLRGSWRRSLLMGAVLVAAGAAVCVALIGWGRIGMRDPEIRRIVAAEESYVTAGCTWDRERFGVEVCVGGSTEPRSPVVLLVGDSHASQWASAFAEAGEERGFTVAVRASSSCAAAGQRPSKAGEPQTTLDECRRYQTETDRLIDSGGFAAVIASDSVGSRPGVPEEWGHEMDGFVQRAQRAGAQVGVMVDNPDQGEVLRCLARGQGSRCTVRRVDATSGLRRYQPTVDRLAARDGVVVFDLTDEICPNSVCRVEMGGVIVPARAGHLSRDFTISQTPAVSDFVGQLLGD